MASYNGQPVDSEAIRELQQTLKISNCLLCNEPDAINMLTCDKCKKVFHPICGGVTNSDFIEAGATFMCDICVKISNRSSNMMSSCGLCDMPDNQEMVQCDDCDAWFHFSCVGVTSDVASVPWSCGNCKESEHGDGKNTDQREVETSKANDIISVADSKSKTNKSIRSSASAIALKLKLLSEEHDLMAEEMEKRKQLLARKHQLLEQMSRISEASSRCSNKSSVASKTASINKWLKESWLKTSSLSKPTIVPSGPLAPTMWSKHDDRSFDLKNDVDRSGQQQMATNNITLRARNTGTKPKTLLMQTLQDKHAQSFHSNHDLQLKPDHNQVLREPYQCLDRADKGVGLRRENQPNHRKQFVDARISDLNIREHSAADQQVTISSYPTTTPKHEQSKVEFNINQNNIPSTASQMFNQWYQKTYNQPPRRSPFAHNTERQSFHDQSVHMNSAESQQIEPQLNSQHVIARSSKLRELPTFTGKPDEWPLFICNFEQSTANCGLSNSENLIRLQKALKSKAFESVKSMLTLPDLVPNIISTLRRLYGRPEAIIQSLLDKIRHQPAPKPDKLDMLITFALSVKHLSCTMEACNLSSHQNNPVLLQELTDKLPAQEKMRWARFKATLADVNIKSFADWLDDEAELASTVVSVSSNQFQPDNSTSKGSRSNKKEFVNLHTDHSSKDASDKFNNGQALNHKQCRICKSSCKTVDSCLKFKNMDYNARWAAIKGSHLCRTCLQKHNRKPCASKKECGVNGCMYKHHAMLHKVVETDDQAKSKEAEPEAHLHACQFHSAGYHSILFKIIPVTLYANEIVVKSFAFLDDGSSLTLMEDSLKDELGLIGAEQPLCLKWTANTHRTEEKSKVISFEIGHDGSNSKYQIINARSVKSLDLPIQDLKMNELSEKYPYLRGVPATSYNKAVPRLLIGIDNAKLMLPLRSREGSGNGPFASKTRLGWMIYGKYELQRRQMLSTETKHPQHNSVFNHFHICECSATYDEDLQSLVKNYFNIENHGIKKSCDATDTPENQRARSILEKTTKRVKDRFQTGLLWRYDNVHLPNSLPMAKRRLQCLIKKMNRDENLARHLDDQIQQFVKKGYCRKLTSSEINVNQPLVWYLPMFPVTNPNKPEKIRLVWDAAATVDGISLNSALMKGPDLLRPLPAVLYKFRERPYAICADIQEMYHQVLVRPEDQHVQRFLWPNPDPSKPPDTYVMNVMTFGASCSPTCAQYVKNFNASQFQKEFPRAHRAITENHYVDDLLDSLDTEEEAVELAKQVKMIHAHGGFNIRNWRSNSRLVLESVDEHISQRKNLNINCESRSEKVLGMWWNSTEDTFSYSLIYNKANADVLSGKSRPSKRELLRTVSSIYDPLGLMANYLVHAKIILQEVWRSGIGWDEKVKDPQYESWLRWVKVLPDVERIRIPRWYQGGNSAQLHLFVDASENAYGVVAYLRYDDLRCSLVGGKTRVAPLKMTSIPRLELEACLLGARYAKAICEGHGLVISKRCFWSDSKTALAWIKSDHRRYKQYVAFRVSETLDLSAIHEWRWVPSKLNVADELTKWRKFNFESSSRWFKGPDFLYENESAWPEDISQNHETCEEMKVSCLHVARSELPIIESSRFSKWSILLRAIVMVLRYVNNLQKRKVKRRGVFESSEYRLAETFIYRQAQIEGFAEERAVLIKNIDRNPNERIQLPKSSSLANCSPFIDDLGVLRIRGRIEEADVPLNMKRPIILPKNNHITNLVLQHYHAKYHHINHETTINEVRQKFYIPQLRVMLKEVRRQCQRCKNDAARPSPPEMAILPKARVSTFCRPFTYVGIDYFGPLYVIVGRSTMKRWGVLFTCLSIRAVHLEIAHTLTTDSCIMAIENFMNRRGRPAEIYSDNGTNLKGAESELKRELKNLDRNRMSTKFTSSSTKWTFIPPLSPHMGGSWERLVRSVKSVLYQIKPTRLPSDELLLNMFIAVENIVNTRPLTYMPLDSENDEALTPNHFLLGSSNGSKPRCEFSDEGAVWRKNWMRAQQFADSFWRRWIREYLPTLTRRTKWFSPVKSIEKGDVVIIVDEMLPRNSWPKGIVLEVTAGKDGQVRKAVVQTSSGIYTRPAVKLAVLDVRKDTVGKPIQIDVLDVGKDTVGKPIQINVPGGSVGNPAI